MSTTLSLLRLLITSKCGPKREVLEVINVERNDQSKHIGKSTLLDNKWNLNIWRNIKKTYMDYKEMQEALKPFENNLDDKKMHKYDKLDEKSFDKLLLLIPFRKWHIVLRPALSEALHTYYVHFHGTYIGNKYKDGDVVKILQDDELLIKKEIEILMKTTEVGKEQETTTKRREEISKKIDEIMNIAQKMYNDNVLKVNNIQDVVQKTVISKDHSRNYLIQRLQIVGEVLHVFMQSYKEGKDAAVKDAVSNDGVVDQLAAAAAEVERGFEREKLKKEEKEINKKKDIL